ncbi:MAG TPA: hypothetical protein VFQ16_01795 [Burkholderiaceae bacterium]|nr:hypothetical protein [Burkholderiaceae bacterium]
MDAVLNPEAAAQAVYELHFSSLFHEGRGYAFACDADGRIDLDTLSERARACYFYARALVGQDFARPVVQRVR